MRQTGDVRIDEIMPRLNETWPVISFEECLVPCKVQYAKLKGRDIRPSGRIPVVDQGESFISGYTDDPANEYPGQLPVIIFGDHTRRFKFVDFKFAIGADGTRLLYPFDALEPRFFYHYLCTLNLEAQGYSRHYKFLKEVSVPIPPCSEQRRIVAKLEKLLDKVEACQKRLAKIPILLKRFRQSVLAAACSGRLTEDWREQNSKVTPVPFGKSNDDLPVSWRECPLSDVVRVTSGEAFKKSEYSPSGAKLLQIANVSFGKIIWDQQNFLPLSYLKSHSGLVLSEGDILMALNRPLLNWRIKVARLMKPDLPSILYQRVGRFLFIGGARTINANFLFLFLQSFGFIHELNERLRGTDQPYINPPDMLEIFLPAPPPVEQQEIVRRVEALFAVADKIEARYIKAKVHVDKLIQSILAKAFRGDLVSQDPSDEPADRLLKQIKSPQERDKASSLRTRASARSKKTFMHHSPK